MSLQPGQVLDGKYKIVRVIGEGGMGAVYEGENVRIRRRVAIKVLHTGVAANTEMVQRFEREAQVAGTVGNDHILEILDLGALPSGERYMVMEYLDGETLTERIKQRGRLSPAETVQLMRQVLRGLAAAHGAGIVHRDLKPDNIFILREKAGIRDFVKIIDFGISKFAEQSGVSSRMTRTGALMGTPHYMAPEQATGSTDIDRRTDIYAVGIIMYEAVTGRVPFQAETFNQLLFEIALAKIVPAREIVPELDPAIDSIIMKASARDPLHRFQTSEEFVDALDAWERSGAAVALPPGESIEAIVAATVPRVAAQSYSGAGAVTPGTGAGVVSRTSSAGGRVEAVAAPDPTVNTWSNTSQAGMPPKRPVPIMAATALGMLLFAGAGVFAYLRFKTPATLGAPAPSASTLSVTTVASEVASPSASEAPPDTAPAASEETRAPGDRGTEPASSATAGPSSHPTTPVVHTPHPVAHHKVSEKPPKLEPKPKPKVDINFGY